jgi:hypothetical protein
MALLDLSLVTQALVSLLEKHIFASPAWGAAAAPKITPQPPDQLSDDTLGFYLIHVGEDPHFKNQPPVGATAPPIRYTPMGLQLTYQVIAHSAQPTAQSTLNEQLLLGLAMKALHDYPSLDDTTTIQPKTGPPVPVFPKDLQGHGNLIRVALLPIPHSEAAALWTGQNEPPRLALYYQVSVVMLEPEKLRARAGRVLRYGVQTFAAGAPRLDGSRNTLTVLPPGEPAMPLVLSPAVAPAAAPAGPPSADAKVSFTGANLVGDDTALSLLGAQWPDPVDTGWPVFAAGGEAQVTLQETIAGASGPRNVLPGVYSARVVVKRRRQMPDGSVRVFPQTSNATPFLISPRIDSITGAAGLVTVTGGLFDEPDVKAPPLAPDAREVHVGEQQLKEVGAAVVTPPAPGQFQVADPHTIVLRLPAGLASGPTPLKVIVRGAESPPRWIDVP